MASGNALFKGLSRSLVDKAPQPPPETDRVFGDVPMVMSRQGTHATDPTRDSPVRKGRNWSQEDQNKYDAQTKKKVLKELVSTWMDRLQLISVITTFFAAIEAQLLSVATPSDRQNVPRIGQAAATTLACSLVVHIFAAILSFIAAFFLVRFRLNEAAHEELKVEGRSTKSSEYDIPRIITTNPHLEPVGPFRKGHPPTHLLERCHTISMFLALVGFILASVGVMCYVWASLPRSASVASTLCVVVCCAVSLAAIFVRPEDAGTKAKSLC